MGHVGWAVLGMVCYSLTSLLVKLATRTGTISVFAVLAIATAIVAAAAALNAYLSGVSIGRTAADLVSPGALYSYAAGVVLAVAVGSLFKGLSLGPASEVVPIYGMFILGGALLGIVVLGEPFTSRKALGFALAVLGVYLIAS